MAGIRQLTGADGVLRRIGHPDDRRAVEVRVRPGPPPADGARRGRAGLQPATGVTDLKFTGPLLADIYLGKIKKWNDPAIAKVNPGVKLPATDIAVAHRSDGSGTTFIWVDYLSKVSPEFKSKVGANASVNWPVGVGGKGNDGVAGVVSQTPGAIGYVELIYALQNKISFGAVQNATGEFIKASPDAVTKAAAGATIPADFRVSITNAPGAGAYPISSFTWILLYQMPSDTARSKMMVDFMKWALDRRAEVRHGHGLRAGPRGVVVSRR